MVKISRTQHMRHDKRALHAVREEAEVVRDRSVESWSDDGSQE